MKIEQVAGEGREAWDAFTAQQPFFALLQTWQWGEFKQRMGWQVYRLAVKEQDQILAGAQVLIKPLPAGFGSIAYIPRGPLCDWTDRETTGALLAEIHGIARAHRAVFLKIEPPLLKSPDNDARLHALGFWSTASTNQPRNTLVMDIDRDPEVILGQMRKKTRQYIHKAEREGVTVRTAAKGDLPAFIELMEKTGKREHFPPRSRSYYELEWEGLSRDDGAVYFLAFHEDRLTAVRSAYRYGAHAAEFHAGHEDNGPEVHANYLLVWKCIEWARAGGCKTFDLWGIPDDIGGSIEEDERQYARRTDGLWGVYHFKSGFCRNVVSYVGAFDYVYSPIPYAVFSNLLNRDAVERLAVWVERLRR